MASLTRYSKGFKVRYRVYYPDGSNRVAFAYRSTQRDAMRLKGQAESLESITGQNALTSETAIPFVHHRLLTPEDLQVWFPKRATLTFNRRVLLHEYEAACHEEMTSPQAIAINLLRAAKLIDTLGNPSTVDEARVRRWRQSAPPKWPARRSTSNTTSCASSWITASAWAGARTTPPAGSKNWNGKWSGCRGR